MGRSKQFDEQQVLEKAMELFWKKGYHDTSVQDLVDHLAINRASLYDTYGGKDTLFEKTFENYQQRNLQWIKNFLAQQPAVKPGLLKLFTNLVDQLVTDTDHKGCFVVNITTELIPNEEKWRPVLNRNRETMETLFFQLLQRGVAQGEISPDKDLKSIAAFLFTLNNGLHVVAKINPSRKDLLQVVEAGLTVLN